MGTRLQGSRNPGLPAGAGVVGAPTWAGRTLPLRLDGQPYALEDICRQGHTGGVEVHRSRQFARWVDDLVRRAKSGDAYALRAAKHVLDELNYIKALDREPDEDTATLKVVRQSRRHRIWRLSHPFDPQMAVRVICWFDDRSDTVVVALFANDKAPMGDVFYDSVGSRADQAIDQWKVENEGKRP